MSRADRLLELLDILRRHRGPTSGKRLAHDLGISLRSLYRDIESLRARGAEIEGEAGFGYVLKPGFLLPPLMFSHAEIGLRDWREGEGVAAQRAPPRSAAASSGGFIRAFRSASALSALPRVAGSAPAMAA